jgi:hypothetical protein
MRSKKTQRVVLGVAFVMIALQFWMLVVVSRWLMCDSRALDAFTKDHPVLAFIAALLWTIGDFGGVYVLVLLLAAAFWWLTIRKSPSDIGREPHNNVPEATAG